VTVAGVLPTLDHPALRIEPTVEQGSNDDGDRPRAPRLLAAPRRDPGIGRARAPRHHAAHHAKPHDRQRAPAKHGKAKGKAKPHHSRH
jgi:hypothetical protein